MNKLKQYGLLFLVAITSSISVQAQEMSEHHSIKGNLGVSAVMGHAFIKNRIDSENKISSAAAFGINANYWVSDKWAVGVHSDLVFENFIIEEKKPNEEHRFLEREYPVSVNAVATYKPIHSLGILAGIGREFSKEKNLTMFVAPSGNRPSDTPNACAPNVSESMTKSSAVTMPSGDPDALTPNEV